MITEFEGFPKIPRLKRNVVITEKIDGTNAQLAIPEDYHAGNRMRIGSRNRWITPQDDNFGFARWATEHEEELVAKLGPGRHFGEWWGAGIQRRYGLTEKRFTLFNSARWNESNLPSCCSVVPVLYAGEFTTDAVEGCMRRLREGGSVVAPGFMNPEGVVVYMQATGQMYKVTFDDKHKGAE